MSTIKISNLPEISSLVDNDVTIISTVEEDVLKSKKINLTNFSDYIKNKIHGTDNIVKSVNGISADGYGNIELTSIPTITDTISYTQIDGNLPISKIENLQTELDSKISSVIVIPKLQTGTEIAKIEVDGEQTTLYIPNQITGLKDLAFKDKILSSDIEGQLSASQIAGLSASQIEGLKDLAFKDKILSSDIENNLPISKIENLQTELDSKISSVIVIPKLQTGTEIATIEVDGESKTLYMSVDYYALSDHNHDDRYLQLSSVVVTPNLTTGTEIATIDVNGESKTLYAPIGVTTDGGVTNVGIGSIIAFAGKNIPDNTLLCDGSEVSKTDYEALWLVIGDRYGQASDSSKFKLPNLNERFIEGISSDLSVGQYLEAGLPNITGQFGPGAYLATGTAIGAFSALDNSAHKDNDSFAGSDKSGFDFDASRSNEIYGKSDTVQPSAVLMKYVIVYKQIETCTSGGYGGGVIDGSIWKDKNGNELVTTITKDETTSMADNGTFNTSTKTLTYHVKNDCYLYISVGGMVEIGGTSSNPDSIAVYVNGAEVTRLLEHIDGDYDCSSCGIHVAEGSVVTLHHLKESSVLFSTINTGVSISFTEFKLRATNVIAAMPDWDDSKAVAVTDGWVAQADGYLIVRPKSGSDNSSSIYANGVWVGHVRYSDTYSSVDFPSQILISKGDVVTFTHFNVIESATFYPVKMTCSVSQEVPSNCASYVIESGRFNSSTGKSDSNNDSWYRLYSDGWCEQGGVCNLIETQGSEDSKTITMRQSYSNTKYSILCTETGTGEFGTTSYLNKTDKSFIVQFDDNIVSNESTQEVSWEAKGFIKQ